MSNPAFELLTITIATLEHMTYSHELLYMVISGSSAGLTLDKIAAIGCIYIIEILQNKPKGQSPICELASVNK